VRATTGLPSRRTVLRAGAATALGALLGGGALGCASEFAGTRLTLGTGGSQGVYYTLGGALADAWSERLGMAQRPTVRGTAGSVENLALLASGSVDVIFSTADVADTALAASTPRGRAPRALARIYDDALQVVVPANSPITLLTELRGRRVSVGATDSQVIVAANRLLAAAGLSPQRDLTASQLGIDESIAALRDGDIDAFFWSGGLPTGGLAALSADRPIRLLDLTPVVPAIRAAYPVYDVGTVPAATYGIPAPVTTLFVRNFLLVAAELPDDLAEALVAGMFAERDRLVRANPAGRVIDTRSAIGTQPVPLHPGAERFYRSAKEYD
jgi:TRAP transporter TAXI family solute receptor